MDSQMQSDLNEPIISVTNLRKQYDFTHGHRWGLFGPRRKRDSKDGYVALHDISFSVRRGEAVGVIGKNGAGKSTLLQILTGTLQPSSGSVRVNGRVSALLELGGGFNPEFTGRENVRLTAAALGMPRNEIDEKYAQIEQFADIGDFIDRPVKTYSSGMLVRLAFALQVHVDPDILIVDEALSVGDVFFQQKCITKIREILARGVTLFFVSHGLNSVKSLCQRAIYLRGGTIVADGPADDVCDLYQNSLTTLSMSARDEAVAFAAMAGSGEGDSVVEATRSAERIHDPTFEQRLSQRSGGGELVFTGIEIRDDKNEVVHAIEQCGEVRLRVEMQANQDIPAGACIGMLIRDANGVDLIGLNSNFHNRYLPPMQSGKRYVWEVVTHLPLARGYYSVHGGVKPTPDSPYFYDRCFSMAVLEVIGNPVSWGDYGGRVIHQATELNLYTLD
jgi:lipopolysaccharide transport system ATP-binding protein